MNCPVEYLVDKALTAAFVFLGAWLAFLYNGRLELGRRKAAAAASVLCIREQIHDRSNAADIHANTLPSVRDAIFQIVGFISTDSRRNKLISHWMLYRDTPQKFLDSSDAEHAMRTYDRKISGLSVDYGHEALIKMLDYLESQIRNA